MKKTIILSSVLFALLSISSCTKEQLTDNLGTSQEQVPEGYFKPILKADLNPMSGMDTRGNSASSLFNNEAQSRHHVSMTGKTNWVEGDTLLVSVVKKIDKDDETKIHKLPKYTFINRHGNSFEQVASEEQLLLAENTEYVWHVCTPGKLNKYFLVERIPTTGEIKDFYIAGPSFYPATQSTDSPDEHLGSMDEMTGSCSAIGQPSITMKHLGTLLKFTIKNNTGEEFKLEKLQIQTSNPKTIINGIDKRGDGIHWQGIPQSEIKISGDCTLRAGESFTVTTIVKDFALNENETFTTFVKTNVGVFQKEYLIKKNFSFAAGTWNSATIEVKAEDKAFDENNVFIPDTLFRNALCKACNKAEGEPLSKADLESITRLTLEYNGKSIHSLEGLEYLTNLTYFHTHMAYSGSPVSFAKNTKLDSLYIMRCGLAGLDVTNNKELKHLCVWHNSLNSINLENNLKLESANLVWNDLTNLDVSKNIALTELNVRTNQLTKLNLPNTKSLQMLDASRNHLESINLDGCPSLTNLDLSYNKLTSLNLQKNQSISRLLVLKNQLKELDISKCDKKLGTSKEFEFSANENPDLKTIWVWEGFHETERPECFPEVTTDLYKVKQK